MPKCKDCGTFYRNMDHSVYDCAQAGGKEAQAMMGPRLNGSKTNAAIVRMNDAEAAKWANIGPPKRGSLQGAIATLQESLSEAKEHPLGSVHCQPLLTVDEVRALLVEIEVEKP